MTKISLDIEYDYGFVLVGISCHEKDYRICWAMNKALNIALQKQPELQLKERKQTTSSLYALYSYTDNERYCEYHLIANRCFNGWLLPEQKQADYLLKITGHVLPEEKKDMLKIIKNIGIVLTAYEIDPNQLKSKQNLLF